MPTLPHPSARVAIGVLLAGGLALGQAPNTAASPAPAVKTDRATAYYHYSMGHLYGELAAAYGGRGEYLSKAIDNYRLALKADPAASFVTEELADLYIQSNRLREGVQEAEEALRQNPEDLNSRRILGRIYTRLIGDAQAGRIDEGMLKRATEQYQRITEKAPGDLDSWLVLGRLHKVGQNSVEAEKAYQRVLAKEADNEEALMGMAMVYSDLGETKKAAEMLRRVVAKNPSSRTLLGLAAAYEQMRDFTLAAETYKKALDLSPGNAEITRALAQARLYAEQYDEALSLYEGLVTEDPKDVASLLRISQIHRQKQDFTKAREASERARKVEPNNIEVQYNEVNLLDAEGRSADAITALKRIVDAGSAPTNPGERANRVLFLERLGLMYRANEQYPEAIATFRRVAETDPEAGARAAAQVIDTLRMSRDFAKAEAEAEAALKKYPNDRLVRAVRASALADAGKADLAAAEMRKLLDGKNDRETYLSLAQVYDKAKNYGEMTKAIDAAEKLSTTNEEKQGIYFARGAMLEKQKRYDLAEAEFRKVLAIDPKSASALNYLGYMLADRGIRLNEAQEMIAKALEIDPNNGAYLDSLGWVYYRLNRLPEAETSLRRAIERYSKDPTVHDHLGDVLLKSGRLKEAIAQWEQSLRHHEAGHGTDVDPAEVAKIQKKLESTKVRLAKESSAPSANKQR